jgi:hypothetical protein
MKSLSRNVLLLLLISWGISLPIRAAEPEPQVWYLSNTDTPDLTAMFSHPEQWARARAHINIFQFSPQQVMGRNQSGLNTSDDLARVDAFRKLSSWNIGIAIQAPAIKEWDCTGKRAGNGTLQYINNVRKAGGVVRVLALDEPLNSGIGFCSQTLQQVARSTSAYIKYVKSQSQNIEIGDIEGYPGFSADQIMEFAKALEDNGTKPAFIHIDTNIPKLAFLPNVNMAADFRAMQTFFKKQGIAFGVIIWSGYNPEPSDLAYYTRSMEWAKRVHEAIGSPDHIDFEAWVWRSSKVCPEGKQNCTMKKLHCSSSDPPYCGKRTVPLNLPDNDPTQFTQTRLVLDVLKLFGDK